MTVTQQAHSFPQCPWRGRVSAIAGSAEKVLGMHRAEGSPLWGRVLGCTGQGPGMHRAEAGLPWGRVLEASPPTLSPLTLKKIIIIFF